MQQKQLYILIAAFALGCFFLHSCQNNLREVQALSKKKIQVEEGKNIVSYLSQSAVVKGKLTAPLMINYHADTPYVEFPKGLHADVYLSTATRLPTDSLVIETVVSAKYARYTTNDLITMLKDSVVIYNKITGDSLHTQQLWWDQRQAIFYTEKPAVVYIKANDQNMIGHNGLRALQNLSKWSLLNPTGTMDVPGGIGQ